MDNESSLIAAGDNCRTQNPTETDKTMKQTYKVDASDTIIHSSDSANTEEKKVTQDATSKICNETDFKLKERIDQCKNIIESLKNELNAEKAKLEKEAAIVEPDSLEECPVRYKKDLVECVGMNELTSADSGMYNLCVERKLHCDDSLLEYEKQLQKYQNTLNMAQMEKKNAIRKQMLAKAFKLKLMEVENQCNIELLRVKQSLQCLEPLQLIANKWKESNDDSVYDISNYDLIPRFLEFGCSTTGAESFKKDGSEANLASENLDVVNSDFE